MKSITLDEIDKERIIEICKFLFPDYEDIFLSTSNPGHVVFFKGAYDKKEASCQNIHWYELCSRKLLEMVFEKLFGSNKKAKGRLEIFFKFHTSSDPVSVIYQAFEKIR